MRCTRIEPSYCNAHSNAGIRLLRRCNGWDRRDGGGGVEQSRVGVDSHRQPDVGMPHESLRRARCNARPRQPGSEGGSERMNVNRSAASVAFGNSRPFAVGVEPFQEAVWDCVHERVGCHALNASAEDRDMMRF